MLKVFSADRVVLPFERTVDQGDVAETDERRGRPEYAPAGRRTYSNRA